ncbi:hypothetical protein L6452_44307 [Arctium lappa]|uniref:Uncharacterized protein n=1 Tax=Arctium lappa TaxID=4217 RepID=A0ACB8XEQ7_ARCLA|nr:hypothetical protein L6452_44307 [Arctium lappa]
MPTHRAPHPFIPLRKNTKIDIVLIPRLPTLLAHIPNLHLDVSDHAIGAKGVDTSVVVLEFVVGERYWFTTNLADLLGG